MYRRLPVAEQAPGSDSQTANGYAQQYGLFNGLGFLLSQASPLLSVPHIVFGKEVVLLMVI